ncbi:UDP-N-acetylmuramate--L-alanine ligase [bacterium BMS3Bbin09]|nr:UDP-N-acetylmuramate--L-alanine ligase [bacterium BMS3Bbin09]
MNEKKLKIFFSGIGGSGLSAIAGFMAERGHTVAGSDRAFDNDLEHPLKKKLQASGISIMPQDGSGLDSTFDLAVFSTAVESDKPEALKAKELGIKTMTRPDYLAEITEAFDTIAVSGTSGKSTTSGMLAFLMERLGLEPNFIGGGRVVRFRSDKNPGNWRAGDSDRLVIEACESDGTIVNYRPQYSIILNLALDHHPVDETAEMFGTFIRNSHEKVILNADDEKLMELSGKGAVTFSINARSEYRPDKVEYGAFSTDFTLHGVEFTLSLPGRYNLYNALSCIAFLSYTGTPLDAIAEVLPEFDGIDRRFDIYLNDGKHLVIDDYAHNPHKIEALMETVKRLSGNVCYIFQPHGFGPTRLMKDEYINVFAENLRISDRLILLPIYYVGGTAAKDISSNDLADGINARNRSAFVIEDRKETMGMLDEYRTFVVFGARDESLADLAREIAERLTR